jgi:predicted RNA polymerase sigma factor
VAMAATDINRTIDAVWRIEQAKLIAALTRLTRDVGTAEELAQDALVAALRQWPESGIPSNPGAWLMQAAKHRAIDVLRRNTRLDRKHEEIGRELAELEQTTPDLDSALDDNVGDDLLRRQRLQSQRRQPNRYLQCPPRSGDSRRCQLSRPLRLQWCQR